jgi:hypothetical protein
LRFCFGVCEKVKKYAEGKQCTAKALHLVLSDEVRWIIPLKVCLIFQSKSKINRKKYSPEYALPFQKEYHKRDKHLFKEKIKKK